MDIAIGFLTFGTLGFVLAFAYISARVAEKKIGEDTEPSALAAREPRWTPRTTRHKVG